MLANPTTPAPRPLTRWTGRALLHWARLLQHTVAGLDRRKALVARRNSAMRAAHQHGIDRDAIARAVGLSTQQTRKALKGEPTVE
ncbi:hypothetical protein ACFYV5_10125 [Streptomyces sp. NPDC003035]|uniref:hypothetical protein n=1 Tax=Streptomyces sp. NPDC003035 TaxID=3364676 RepID=UPI0036791DBD